VCSSTALVVSGIIGSVALVKTTRNIVGTYLVS